MKKRIYNPSECRIETATIHTCRCCRGVGHVTSTSSNPDGECQYCGGHGRLWVCPSTWSKKLYERGEGRYGMNTYEY